ncbi:hypothetical protein SNK04_003949 [Fusarium graminearum]
MGEDTYCEHARAETTDGSRSNLGDVDRSDDGSLTNTETTDEATSIDSTEVSIDTTNHEDDNTKSPERAEESSSPNTTDAITDQESTKGLVSVLQRRRSTRNLHQSTTNGTNLHHGRDIGLDVGLLNLRVRLIVDLFLEILGVEGSRDETLIDTSGGTEERKGHDGEP